MNLLQQGVLEPQSTNHVVIMGNALQPTQRLFVITMAESEKYLPFPIGSHSNLLPFFYFFPIRGGTRISLISEKNFLLLLQGVGQTIFLLAEIKEALRTPRKQLQNRLCKVIESNQNKVLYMGKYGALRAGLEA